ncbi:hypothetical protein KUTeg_011869 [Tegillarca granosa]|uniref:Transcriptional coactivator p15 (PC4) C-terminal domain-containing protein n=1 Tax=Tegillarca granosa TaxID=220873 RepID=A0ABQ9EY50_TEGGR|nr:hypothetical protein KUTeg_011869 [Tegillarca granosa]
MDCIRLRREIALNFATKMGKLVNKRKWFLPEGQNEILPTKKGIALTFRQWEFLVPQIWFLRFRRMNSIKYFNVNILWIILIKWGFLHVQDVILILTKTKC